MKKSAGKRFGLIMLRIAKLLTLLGFLYSAFFQNDNKTLSAAFTIAYFGLLIVFAFAIFRKYSECKSLSSTLESVVNDQFGAKLGAYLLFETKLVSGAIRLFLSPWNRLKQARESYFVRNKDVQMLWVLVLFMILEPAALHLLIESFDEADVRFYAHVALFVLELYGVAFVFGNIYYLAESRVWLDNEGIDVRLGIVSRFASNIDNMDRVTWNFVRGMNCPVPKVSLTSGPNVRIVFREPVDVQFLFFGKKAIEIDVYSKPREVAKLKSKFE